MIQSFLSRAEPIFPAQQAKQTKTKFNLSPSLFEA